MKSLIIKKDDDKFSTIDKNDMLEVIGNHSHLNVIENKNQIHKDGTYLLINDEFNEYSLSLTCDNDIISVDGDNATFTAVLEHNGVVCEGKYITFHANEIEQSVKTDQNGIATFVYEPQGAGLVNVIASFMLLQETFVLWDTITFDNGTSLNHNDIWQTPTNQGKLIREDEYSNLIETIASDTAIGILLPSQNIKIEFDLFNVDGGTQNFYNINIRRTNNAYINGFGLNEMGCYGGLWHHIICEIGEGSFNVSNTTNTRTITNRTLSSTESQILFQIKTDGQNTNLRFKNFKVYSL